MRIMSRIANNNGGEPQIVDTEAVTYDYTPLLIVVSAPSGAGKTTLCDRLLAAFDNMVYSVSCTTRAPRGEEQDGTDYHFVTEEQFRRRAEDGEFLEFAQVHGYYYGTLAQTVRQALAAGHHVLLDIDVQGVDQIREALMLLDEEDPLHQGFVDIFIAPPSLAALRQRLEGRAEDTAEVIERRMGNAELEMARAGEYDYCVVNDELDKAFGHLKTIIAKESIPDE